MFFTRSKTDPTHTRPDTAGGFATAPGGKTAEPDDGLGPSPLRRFRSDEAMAGAIYWAFASGASFMAVLFFGLLYRIEGMPELAIIAVAFAWMTFALADQAWAVKRRIGEEFGVLRQEAEVFYRAWSCKELAAGEAAGSSGNISDPAANSLNMMATAYVPVDVAYQITEDGPVNDVVVDFRRGR